MTRSQSLNHAEQSRNNLRSSLQPDISQTSSECLLEQIVMNVSRLASQGHSYRYQKAGGDIVSTDAPIVCSSCDLVFRSYEEFSSMTDALKPGCQESGVCSDGVVVFEYRRCECQGIVSAVRLNKRDETPFGVECRAYFTVAVMQLAEKAGMNFDDAKLIIRLIYEVVFSGKPFVPK